MTAEPKATTLVLGLGNPLRGDDGVGLAVLEQLRQCELAEGTTLVDGGTGGLETTLEFANMDTVLVIDAARFDGQPGEVRRFDLLSTQSAPTNWGAGHAHGLLAAIELARALSLLPRQLVLFAIEPADTEAPLRLSPSATQAVAHAVAAVLAELTLLRTQSTG